MSFSSLKMKSGNNYEDAIRTLNGLISNASTIAKSIEKGTEVRLQHIPRTKMFCERAGVQLKDISKLNFVHVAGTKGKGSTSTYIDAILHNHGFKTGLFTSPHLMEVRERIKINGFSISKLDFSRHFWQVYDHLSNSTTSTDDMPFYFQFLTIMALHVFLEEKVDYVVLETGIGGRFDSTNIIPRSKIACITSLGYDHTDILGTTMSEIAWNKAGIIKPGSLVVTCDSQPQDGLNAIIAETKLYDNKLFLVPVKDSKHLEFMKDGRNIHPENAMLASAVCHLLLGDNTFPVPNHINTPSRTHDQESSSHISNIVTSLPSTVCTQPQYRTIINSTTIPGRYQTIKKGNIDYFIDGAHTLESIMTCVEWFKEASVDRKYTYRFLIFMITGRRSIEDLLAPLTLLKFDGILLSPLVPFRDHQPLDFASDESIIAKEKEKLAEIAAVWTRLNICHCHSKESTEYFNSFEDIDNYLSTMAENVQVLVVGSLHLVGCALALVERNKDAL